MESPQVLKGDCLEVMKTLPAKSIDCFLCDLPYGQLPKSGATSWDTQIDLPSLWKEIDRLSKNDRVPVLMFCNTKFGAHLINSRPTWFRYDLVWDKGRGISFLLANKQPMRSHEMVYVFSKKPSYYRRIDEDSDKPAWKKESDEQPGGRVWGFKDSMKPREGVDGKRCSLSVLRIAKKTSWHLKGSHPTEKPLELYEWLIARYCPEGGTILDPTAGSFNAVQAAVKLGRIGIGIETDSDFHAKALKKLFPDGGDEIELVG